MIQYLLLIVASLALPALIFSFKYQVTYDEERIFTPCQDNPDHYITQFMDVSNLTFDVVSDEEVIIDGCFPISAAIDRDDTMNFFVSVHKEIGGKYQQPLAQINRKDYCNSFFNPTEVWYTLSSKIDEQYRTCPLEQGKMFCIYNWSSKSTVLNLPDPNLSGGYQATINIGFDKKEHLDFCFDLFIHLYKM